MNYVSKLAVLLCLSFLATMLLAVVASDLMGSPAVVFVAVAVLWFCVRWGK